MWLIYLRFDDRGTSHAYHVRTSNKTLARALIELGERHGLTPSAKLVEYGAFNTSGTVRAEPLLLGAGTFLLDEDFQRRWIAADRQLPADQQLRNHPVFVVRHTPPT